MTGFEWILIGAGVLWLLEMGQVRREKKGSSSSSFPPSQPSSTHIPPPPPINWGPTVRHPGSAEDQHWNNTH